LRFLEEAASALGYREITLETRRVNHKAVAFYEKHGYTVTDNYGVYIGRDDAVCFIKTL
jgi:ribosomal protein S18 acetylase RimI-like enzyme